MLGRALRYFARSMRDYTLRRPQLEALQAKRLRRTLSLAYDEVPHYHELMRQMGRTPVDFTIDDLRQFPLLTKEEVILGGKGLVSRRGASFVKEGSGTSGLPLRVYYDQNYVDHAIAFQLRKYAEFGVRPWDRLVTVWPPKKYWRRALFGRKKGKPTTWAEEMGALSTLARMSKRALYLEAAEDDPGQDMRELVRMRPGFALGRPSHFLRMAEFLPPGGAGMDLRGMECRHEAFTDDAARKLEGAFGGKVMQGYGSNETGSGGAECRFQRGIHLNEDWLIYEVLRDGEQVGPGEMGELVVTVLLNDSMPLVRYATGDTVELADGGACECGSWMVRVRKTLGRRQDWLKTAVGTLVPPLEVAEVAEAELGMKEYQIVQLKVGEFVVKSWSPESDERRLAGPLRSYLTQLVGTPVTVAFVEQARDEIWLKNRSVASAVP
ncbi:MAG: phenylacetate--CoA ligase family protein [Nitrososphaerota archaeon]|nr:phenylacetate--CoA ligase family protein [Nitrososphaerota archaeon]